jgi:purine-binding chemotaxis protein CheW
VVEAQIGAAVEREGLVRLVCFQLRDQELAFPIEAVRETIRIRPITHVFLTPSWLIGIFSLRGEILPAIDIAPWLAMPRTTARDDSRLVVLKLEAHGTKGGAVAVLVDSIAELRTLGTEEIAPPPPTLSAEQAALLRGVAATPTGTVRVLNPAALLQSERLRELREPAST